MADKVITGPELENHCRARHNPLWWLFSALLAVGLATGAGLISNAADLAALKAQNTESKEWRSEVRQQLREIREALPGHKMTAAP